MHTYTSAKKLLGHPDFLYLVPADDYDAHQQQASLVCFPTESGILVGSSIPLADFAGKELLPTEADDAELLAESAVVAEPAPVV